MECDNGNGSLMRILPISLYFQGADIQIIIARNFEVSALTHAHIRSRLCCAYYSLLIRHMLNGMVLTEAMQAASRDLDSHVPCEERESLKRILSGSIIDESEELISGNGYVVHCLEASLWCANRFDRYDEAVLAAVNLGEDTDTTAAVTGGLVGVRDGIDAIPAEWQNALARTQDIKALTTRFVDLACSQ